MLIQKFSSEFPSKKRLKQICEQIVGQAKLSECVIQKLQRFLPIDEATAVARTEFTTPEFAESTTENDSRKKSRSDWSNIHNQLTGGRFRRRHSAAVLIANDPCSNSRPEQEWHKAMRRIGSRFRIVTVMLPVIVASMWVTSLSRAGELLPSRVFNLLAEPTFKLRGRIDADFISNNENAAARAIFGNVPDAAGLRRARIGAEGNLTADLRYVTEIDLASGEVVLRDSYAGLKVFDEGDLKVGHMREPFSLEGGTSANSFAFMERSMSNSLDPSRNWGTGYSQSLADELILLSAGLYQSGTDPSDFQFAPGSTTAMTFKGTGLAWYDDDGAQFMHFGAAFSERIADQGTILVGQRPQSSLIELGDSTSSPFIRQLKIPANFQQLINLQWATGNGPWWAQAEWYGSIIDQTGGEPLFYQGLHLDIGYFLTGEHREYLKKSGFLGAVKVRRPFVQGFSSTPHPESLGYGAWELTGRFGYYDTIDENNPRDPLGNQQGVRIPQWTCGVNWYLADHLRVMWNYNYATPDDASAGSSIVSQFGMRLAMFW